jgi:hypothetical protein
MRLIQFGVTLCLISTPLLLADDHKQAAQSAQSAHRIGREVAIPRHLADDEEFSVPIKQLLEYGKELFVAKLTEQEGGGRPEMKGTTFTIGPSFN